MPRNLAQARSIVFRVQKVTIPRGLAQVLETMLRGRIVPWASMTGSSSGEDASSTDQALVTWPQIQAQFQLTTPE